MFLVEVYNVYELIIARNITIFVKTYVGLSLILLFINSSIILAEIFPHDFNLIYLKAL